MLFNLNYENLKLCKLSCFLIGCKVIIFFTTQSTGLDSLGAWILIWLPHSAQTQLLSHAGNTLAAEIAFPTLDQFWCTQEKTAEIEQDLC